jgi:hypothetical protein
MNDSSLAADNSFNHTIARTASADRDDSDVTFIQILLRPGPARRLPRAQSKGPHLDNTMRANQLRLWFSSMAYVALCALRRIGSRHSRFAPTASPSASGASRSPWLRHPLTGQAVHRKPCQKAKDRHGSTQAGVRPKAAQTDFKRSMPAPWSAPPDHHSNLIDV